MDDLLYDEVGLVDKQFVDPKDVSGDVFTDEEESPLPISQSPLQVEVARSVEVFKRQVLDLKSSQSFRSVMVIFIIFTSLNFTNFLQKSPEDQLSYDG